MHWRCRFSLTKYVGLRKNLIQQKKKQLCSARNAPTGGVALWCRHTCLLSHYLSCSLFNGSTKTTWSPLNRTGTSSILNVPYLISICSYAGKIYKVTCLPILIIAYYWWDWIGPQYSLYFVILEGCFSHKSFVCVVNVRVTLW